MGPAGGRVIRHTWFTRASLLVRNLLNGKVVPGVSIGFDSHHPLKPIFDVAAEKYPVFQLRRHAQVPDAWIAVSIYCFPRVMMIYNALLRFRSSDGSAQLTLLKRPAMNSLRALTVGVLLIAGEAGSPAESGDASADARSASSSTQAALPPSAETPASAAVTDAMFKRVTTGFRLSKRGDTKYYCRRETPIGTRLGKRVCYTLEHLVEQERIRILNQRKLEQAVKQRPLEAD